MVLLYPEGVPIPEKPSRYAEAVSSRWGAGGHLMYDPYGGAYHKWIYRFKAVPGLEEMTMALHGELTDLWIDEVVPAGSPYGDHRFGVT